LENFIEFHKRLSREKAEGIRHLTDVHERVQTGADKASLSTGRMTLISV